ncbi:MBL fold metallo-hydrolase [Caproiciproducens sp. CPB-2]|uniref:MBL fold metallo-hydrolase n=1 Tax=Caproiciproducens sp. CPB-2 TaxID=3030017 RepID=UPI0023D9DDD6|nr:MBL fold metallo-hydrolase [Caproiciproducens sp. CPB-2]
MYIKIHRGTAQIGGNLIEIGTDQTRILFDVGANLPPLDGKGAEDSIEIEGLTCGKSAFDWVFLSHHHNDHCGLADRILPGIPILSGEETHRILDVISDFTGSPRPEIHLHFKSGQPIQLDDIRVTPIGVEHSAADAYMFLVQADGKSVLYTGDYRAADSIPTQIRQLLGGQKLDLLISEGTNVRIEKQGRNAPQNENQVEQRACELMKQYEGTVFVLCSSTNEERIRAIHRAAKSAGRAVCEDLFLTAVRTQREENTLRFVAHYTSEEKTPRTYAYFQRYFERRKLLGAESLAKISGKKVIFVRTSMLPFLKSYLACRPDEKNLLIYSIWQGYRETRPVKDLLAFCGTHGIEVADLHCSGHAYRNAIQELIGVLNPQALIPIHCEAQDREQFKALHPNCLMVRDGERWEVSKCWKAGLQFYQ